jgi:hypothetical protein
MAVTIGSSAACRRNSRRCRMGRRADPERIFEAQRAAVRNSLTDYG